MNDWRWCKMVAILLDPQYAESTWCRNIYSSLTDRLREKRIPFCQIYDTCTAGTTAVFVIASNFHWTCNIIQQLNTNRIYPILLCNQLENLPGCIYNCVCSDVNASMKNLLDILENQGKRRIALFGMNPNSIADISRIDSLMLWKKENFVPFGIYPNEGSLAACFESFREDRQNFDAVICANDFAAVTLIQGLRRTDPAYVKKLTVISCASSKISEYYKDTILSLDINYAYYGKAAVYIYEALQKQAYLSEMTIKLAWCLQNDFTTCTHGDIHLSFPISDDSFYDDALLNEMLIVERILSSLSDEADQIILDSLLQEENYSSIAQKCFLSENAVKYRIKRLINHSGAPDRPGMIALLKKYISG